jgi:hypothetical protein
MDDRLNAQSPTCSARLGWQEGRFAGRRKEYRLAGQYRYAGTGQRPAKPLLHHAV